MARLRRLSTSADGGPRLLLWPEAAVTGRSRTAFATPAIKSRCSSSAATSPPCSARSDLLLTGGVTWRSADGREVTSATNSVFAIDPTGRILARYDKAHLVPYGEYLPMRPILSTLGLSRLAPGDVDFDPGPGPQTLDLPLSARSASSFATRSSSRGRSSTAKNRPAFLFNPSNDAWFGAWGPPQHLAQARLRALEEGLPVLRSTPTGISAVIDADGRLLRSLQWRTAGVIDTRLPAPKPPTLFARLGNLLPLLFALLLAALAIVAERIAVRRKGG